MVSLGQSSGDLPKRQPMDPMLVRAAQTKHLHRGAMTYHNAESARTQDQGAVELIKCLTAYCFMFLSCGHTALGQAVIVHKQPELMSTFVHALIAS